MSSPESSTIKKQPYAVIDIPLKKFVEEALPFHKKIYELHKNNILKLISGKNIQQLKRETKDKKNAVRQLKDLQYELDTLRARVEDSSLDKFDNQTFSLHRDIGSLIKDYVALERTVAQVIKEAEEIELEEKDISTPFTGINQIQIQESIEQLKLDAEVEKFNELENINENIQDLHGMYKDLNCMVVEQKESVDIIEANVEHTQEEVNHGIKHLVKACKLKTTAYPITGALIGTVLGGPLGLVAGLKVGGLAAVGFGVAGYTGGRLFKQFNENDLANNENENIENTQTEVNSGDVKKDI